MNWHQTGDKTLRDLMLTQIYDARWCYYAIMNKIMQKLALNFVSAEMMSLIFILIFVTNGSNFEYTC